MRTIDTDSIRSNATTLNEKIEELDSQIDKLSTTIEDNKDGFQGERGTSFFNTLTENYVLDLENLKLDMQSYQDFLSKVPDVYEVLDEEFGNMTIDV